MHGVLLAKHEQRSYDCIGGMSKVSAFGGQRRNLCCVSNGGLEDPIHGILSSRDLANQQDTSLPAQGTHH